MRGRLEERIFTVYSTVLSWCLSISGYSVIWCERLQICNTFTYTLTHTLTRTLIHTLIHTFIPYINLFFFPSLSPTGISMHKGYAFVQFTNPFDARSACMGEDGRGVFGQILGKYNLHPLNFSPLSLPPTPPPPRLLQTKASLGCYWLSGSRVSQ